MNLRDRHFEKSLWHQVRRELKASPVLWQEHCRARPRWWRHCFRVHIPWLFALAYGVAATLALIGEDRQPWIAGAALAFCTLGITGFAAGWVLNTLHNQDALTALYHLPLTDDEVFRARFRTLGLPVLSGMLRWLPIGVALAVALSLTWPDRLIVAALPSCQHLLACALGIHLAAWVPRRWLFNVGQWTGLTLAVAVVLSKSNRGDWLEPLVAAGTWLPLFGWLNRGVFHAALDDHLTALGWLLPAAAVLMAVPLSWRRLRNSYHLHEPFYECPETAPVEVAQSAGKPVDASTIIEAADLHTARSLVERGWLERLVFRWWTRRERNIAEFFLASRPGWSLAFQRMIWVFLAGLAAVFFLTPQYGPLVMILSLLAVALMGLPFSGGEWRGFELRPAGGQFSPMHATYPFGFGEVLRVMLKANLVRLAAGLPFLIILTAAGSWRLTGGVAVGLVPAAKVLVIYLVTLPMILALRFSAGTNDTQLNPGLYVATPLLVLLWLGAAALFLIPVTSAWAVWGLGLVMLLNTLLVGAYVLAWNHGNFDLLTDRRNEIPDTP